MSGTTLRVILDLDVAPVAGGIARYTGELTRELINTAPRGCDVTGVVPASTEATYARIERHFPELAALHKSALDGRQLAAAWQHGFTRLPGSGMVHAPSLFAPLARHDRVNDPGNQIVVTIHDVAAWTHPHLLPSRSVSWHRAMGKRAERYADAIVVPTHAVADALSDVFTLGERVRVIGGAPRTEGRESTPVESEGHEFEVEFDQPYLVCTTEVEPRHGIAELIAALHHVSSLDLRLLLLGAPGADNLDVEVAIAQAGVSPDRVRRVSNLDERDASRILGNATAAIVPSLVDGSGAHVLEAMAAGVPVIHSDAQALVEVAGEAGFSVSLEPSATYSERLAGAIREVVERDDLRDTLRVRGADRVRAFSWRDAAEKTWQLHADL